MRPPIIPPTIAIMETPAQPQAMPFIMTDQPHKKRRHPQIPFLATRLDLQASELEVLRDMQSYYHCSSAEASSRLKSGKEAQSDLQRKKRKRCGREEGEGLGALLGFASFLAESEMGVQADIQLLGPIHRKRTPAKYPRRRFAITSQSFSASNETQTSSDSLLGRIVDYCPLTQRLLHLQSLLHLPQSLFLPAVLYHRREARSTERRPVRAANHLAVVHYIKTSRETLS